MPHTCKDCNSDVFGGGYCKYHQWKRNLFGGDKYKTKSATNTPYKPIPRRTKERAIDEKYYAVQAKEFFDDAIKSETNICVFCGEKVTKYEGLHHWKGRTNDYLLDKQWWSTVHNDCHSFYHRATVEQMKEKSWFDSYMSRLRAKSEELYLKEINKSQKNILFSEEN